MADCYMNELRSGGEKLGSHPGKLSDLAKLIILKATSCTGRCIQLHIKITSSRLNLASQICPRLSVNSTHWLVCLWCWMADLLPPPWPHHVTHSLPPSLGNGPAGCRGAGPARGALWECRLRAISLGCRRGLSLRLNNLLDWGLRSKEVLGALQENASSVVPIDSFPLPTDLSSQNIHAYTGT